MPDTSFSCGDYGDGMYADMEARCQVWHTCYGENKWDFLCPNGTIFAQDKFTCVWWFDFDCETAGEFYSLNEDVFRSDAGGDDGGIDGGGGGTSEV